MIKHDFLNEVPPRIHCFVGPRVSLNDICGNPECEMTDCLWHRDRGVIPSNLGIGGGVTEAAKPKKPL